MSSSALAHDDTPMRVAALPFHTERTAPAGAVPLHRRDDAPGGVRVAERSA